MKSEEGLCILIDLIHIADYTRIVSQMTYILQNYLTFELSKYLIQKQFPVRSRKYLSLLNHLAFTNGLANYLAWNASCSSYKFFCLLQLYRRKENLSISLILKSIMSGTVIPIFFQKIGVDPAASIRQQVIRIQKCGFCIRMTFSFILS